jgi:ubiquinone biosynthesis monooxygenase Coq7
MFFFAKSTAVGKMLRAFQAFGLCKPYKETLISSIVRVDHAGELAADRIYAGQSAVLNSTFFWELFFNYLFLDSEVGPIIQHMWDEEKEHLEITERLLAEHNVNPTAFTPLFKALAYGLGNFQRIYYYWVVLGFGTALIGKRGAMACTIAVEELIGDHYNNQMRLLLKLDPKDNTELLKVCSTQLHN